MRKDGPLPCVPIPCSPCHFSSFKVDWAESNPEKAEEIAANVQRFVRETLSMESVYDYMLRRLQDYRHLMKFNPVVRPGKDAKISSFDDLVTVMDMVMARMKLTDSKLLSDRFVAFNRGDRCCCNCPNIPAYQHLCPGKDLGWLEP